MTTIFLRAKQRLLQYELLSQKNPLAKAGVILSLANAIAGLLGYAYQVLMGRLLPPAEFASLSSLMAMIMLATAPLNSLLMLLSRQVSTLRVQRDRTGMSSLFWSSHILVFAIAFLVMSLLCGFGDQEYFGVKLFSFLMLWLLIGTIICMTLVTINIAFMQAEQQFTTLGISGICIALLKIIFGVLSIELGFGVEGALGSLMLACGLPWLIGFAFYSRRFARNIVVKTTASFKIKLRSLWPVLLANIAFTTMTQIDMVLVSWYFIAEDAAEYAAASVLGKAILYLPGGIALAMFPMVAENNAKNHSSGHMLLQTISMTAILCGSMALVYWALGVWVIDLLYNGTYNRAGELLRYYGLAMLPMAFIMVAEHFLIAKGRVIFAWLFVLISPLQFFAIYLWHDTLNAVILIIGVCGAILAALGYCYLWFDYRRGIVHA